MKQDRLDIFLLIIASICLFFYFFPNMPRENMYELTTYFDKKIPFIPLFVIPYASFHFLLIPATLLILSLQPYRYYLRIFLVSAIFMLVCSNLIFLLFPTYFPLRPDICGNSMCERMVTFIYWIDNPCAVCPSVHVNVSILCAILWWQIRSRYSITMIIWAIIISFSTLFIRQHYIIDVIAGILSAFLSWVVGTKLTNKFFQDNQAGDR